MGVRDSLQTLGFTQYEISCYLTLVNHNPINGSRLSRLSKVPRSKIYDVLRNMGAKGLVVQLEGGLYAPLPPDELVKRLKSNFNNNIDIVQEHIRRSVSEHSYDYIWTIKGHREVITKAREMISAAGRELYVRMHPREGAELNSELTKAEKRGVAVRYVSLGPPARRFRVQVTHPESENLIGRMGGRALDIIADRAEALVGMFELANEEESALNWTRNRWFIISSRDSVRHDFYHYFLHKIKDRGQELTPEEAAIYELIKADD